jgi:hypothetical protein
LRDLAAVSCTWRLLPAFTKQGPPVDRDRLSSLLLEKWLSSAASTLDGAEGLVVRAAVQTTVAGLIAEVVKPGVDLDRPMSNKNTTLHIHGPVQNLAVDGSHVAAPGSAQAVKAPASTPQEVTRDQFERDVIDILHLLADAQDQLEAEYEPVRKALRKLNQLDLERNVIIPELQAKYDDLLSTQDKTALQRLRETSGEVATNIVSSGLWSYLIQPIIGGLS